MPKLILITGIKRSGSTWMYNVVRELYRMGGYKVYGAFVDEIDRERAKAADVVVIKTHPYVHPLAGLADLILYSYRSVEGIKASLRKMGLEDDATVHWDGMLRQANLWSDVADYHMRFDDMMSDKEAEVQRIIDLLSPQIAPSPSICRVVVDAVERMRESAVPGTHDPETLLHQGHQTGAFKELGK